jgi:HK97 family phage major capsid protein
MATAKKTRRIGEERERSRVFEFELEQAESGERAAAGLVVRTVTINGEEFNVYRLSCSSEFPVERRDWSTGETYLEILSHEPKDVDLRRFKAGAAVRDTHWGEQVGITEGADVTAKRKLDVEVRYDKDDLSQKFELGLRRLIRKNVSVRYLTVGKPRIGVDAKTGLQTRTYRWMPIHMSHEADGADPTVGGGRSQAVQDPEQNRELIEVDVPETESPTREEERTEMTEDERKAQEAAQVSDRQKAVDEALKNRRTTDTQIRTMARNANWTDVEVERLLEKNPTREAAAIEILERGATPAKPAPAVRSALDEASPKERRELRKRLSLVDAIEQSAHMRATGGKPTGIVGEWHQRLLAAGGGKQENPGYLLIPYRTYSDEEAEEREFDRARLRAQMGGRAMGTAVVGSGAELVYDQPPMDILDALRPRLILNNLGCTFLPGLKGDLPLPRFTSDAVLHHVDENPGVDVTSTTLGTDVAWLKRKSLAGALPLPKQLMQNSQVALELKARASIAAAAAVMINRKCFHGTGSQYQPMGMWTLPGVTPVAVADSVHGIPAFGDFIDMQTAIKDLDAGSDGSASGYAMTTGLAGLLRKTSEASAVWKPIWTGSRWQGEVAGERSFASNVLDGTLGTGADEHACVYSPDWSMYYVALFGDGMEIFGDPYSAALQQQFLLHLFMMYDGGTGIPELLVKLTGAHLHE